MGTSLTADECPICREESQIRYQCCPNKEDSLCEACWSRIISEVISKGKIASLFTGKLTCDFCRKPIEHDRLPEEVQSKLKAILSTIPKTETPKSIEEFSYSYNNSRELRHCSTNEKFIFLTQRHYNLLGNCIDIYIQSLMKNDPWNYDEIWLPIKDENTNDHHDQVNIFTSKDFKTNENGCLILIQGSGVVRPGQWARSCCINETLDIGAMFPYMAKAEENNLSVIILNPNQTSYIDEEIITTEETASANEVANPANEQTTSPNETTAPVNEEDNTPTDNEASAADMETSIPNGDTSTINKEANASDEEFLSFYLSSDSLPRPSTKKIPNLSTNREHVLYVFDNIISTSPAKKFYIVAHSAGGDGLMYLLRKREETILPKLAKIAFTDSVHSILPFESNEIKNFLKSNALHFVASEKPMGASVECRYDFSQRPACQEVSAGHSRHEYTSGYCVEGVFQFFFPSNESTVSEIDKIKL